MQSRRSLVRSGFIAAAGLAAGNAITGFARSATPDPEAEPIWLEGNSVNHELPEDMVAEAGTIQIVGVSPVLYPEFAIVLIHNATEKPVMLKNVKGKLSSPAVPELEQEIFAYNVPPVALKSGEYWIGKLMMPEEIEVGSVVEFDGEVLLHTDLIDARGIVTILPAVDPESDFSLPEAGEMWPIRYENNVPYRTAALVQFHQIFFDDDGTICGYINSDDKSNSEGSAQFRMELTNKPAMSTGGAIVGEVSDRWLGQWYHAPGDQWFADFEF